MEASGLEHPFKWPSELASSAFKIADSSQQHVSGCPLPASRRNGD